MRALTVAAGVARSAALAVLMLAGTSLVAPGAGARADIPAGPSRPAWDDQPLPEPDPPPEKPLERAAEVAVGLGALALAFVLARRRERGTRAKGTPGHGGEPA